MVIYGRHLEPHLQLRNDYMHEVFGLSVHLQFSQLTFVNGNVVIYGRYVHQHHQLHGHQHPLPADSSVT